MAVPSRSWEFYALARDILGAATIFRIFGVEKSQVSRWCHNPEFGGDTARTPTDRLRLLLERMADAGQVDAARAELSGMAQALGCRLVCDDADPDGATVEAECLDDYPVLTAMHAAIRAGEHPDRVDSLAIRAQAEIAETATLHRRTWGKP